MLKKVIGGKEYTFEFSIEATLYDEVTTSIMSAFVSAGMAQNDAKDGKVEDAMNTILKSMADIPQRSLKLFYAGLLEHHGANGDKSVMSLNDAKPIITQYMRESGLSLYEIMQEMTELMASDNFFSMIGWEKMMETMNQTQTEEKPKRGRKSSLGTN